MSAFEDRLNEAVTGMYFALPPQERRDLMALVELSDAEDAGMRFHWIAAADEWEVRWVGVPLGRVSRAWLHGEDGP